MMFVGSAGAAAGAAARVARCEQRRGEGGTMRWTRWTARVQGREPRRDEDGKVLGRHDFMELGDYRTGNRFRDFEKDWQEVAADDDEEFLDFENVEINEFGIDKDGRDIVEDGMPLKSEGRRNNSSNKQPRTKKNAPRSRGPGSNGSEQTKPKKAVYGTHKLIGALKELRVAASETCEYLISGGLVTVNGKVRTERNSRVDISKDVICVSNRIVNGAETNDTKGPGKTTSNSRGAKGKNASHDDLSDDDDVDIMPRSQRDFRNSGIMEKKRDGEDFYGKKVDGGFLASKRRKPKRK